MCSVRKAIVCLLLVGLGSCCAFADERAATPIPAAPKPARIEDFAPATEFLQVGSLKTHVVQKGESGRPIVLIHGFGSCTYTWRLNIEPLARTFRVYAIDIKGFGLTEKPKDGQYHLAAYTDHLLETINALKLERPILVGNSMGGAIITRLALLHPEKVGGVVLVDAAPPSFMPPALPGSNTAKKAVEPAKNSGPSGIGSLLKVAIAKTLITKKMVEAGLKGAYFDPAMVTPEMVDVYYRPFTIEGAPEALLAMTNPPAVKTAKTPPLRELVPPALIIWGRHDRIIPVTMAEVFARELPKAKKIILEKSGHLPHEEEPDLFNALVAEFAANVR